MMDSIHHNIVVRGSPKLRPSLTMPISVLSRLLHLYPNLLREFLTITAPFPAKPWTDQGCMNPAERTSKNESGERPTIAVIWPQQSHSRFRSGPTAGWIALTLLAPDFVFPWSSNSPSSSDNSIRNADVAQPGRFLGFATETAESLGRATIVTERTS